MKFRKSRMHLFFSLPRQYAPATAVSLNAFTFLVLANADRT
jgi:hypothetical protein